MDERDRSVLRGLLTLPRVLALGVLVDRDPYVGLLPFAARADFSGLLVLASSLARHSRGLAAGAPFAALVHEPERPGASPFELARASCEGEVQPLPSEGAAYDQGRGVYVGRLPESAPLFSLGDFRLYDLRIARVRLVSGFARAVTLPASELASL